jgi:hypothetical protein
MGMETFKIGAEREALQLACDSVAHRDEKVRTAWFACGSYSGNLALATAAGWIARRNGIGAWLCPQCAQDSSAHPLHLQRQGSPLVRHRCRY